MVCSMTAFSRIQSDECDRLLCWELKSVNHRYLDVSFRLPEAFRFLEPTFRSLFRGKLHRGKIECHLKIMDGLTTDAALEIDTGLLQSLLSAGEALSTDYHLANDLSVSHVITWPNLLHTKPMAVEALGADVAALFEKAVLQLIVSRKTEGSALLDVVKIRLQALGEEVAHAHIQAKEAIKKSREKLLTRLDALNLSVSDTRLEQELALMLTRLDVSEELDRLSAHCAEVFSVFERNEPIGKRLDFLMQELNREANTLGSKSDSVALTQHAVQMKVLIEQMREQIQNIE